MPSKIPQETLDKLRKLQAMFDHPATSEIESAAAFGRVRAILVKGGWTLADLYGAQREPSRASGTTSRAYDDELKAAEEVLKEWRQRQAEQAERERKARKAEAERQNREQEAFWRSEADKRAQRERPERDGVIRRYGSVEAVLRPCVWEMKLHDAVRQWSVKRRPPNQRWTASIDGWCDYYGQNKVTARVRAALSNAYPLPLTVSQAWNEHVHWERRDHEIGLVLEDTGNTNLDLTAFGRWEIVRTLLETGLRARTINEVLIRQRYLKAGGTFRPEIDHAVLADLEAIVAAQEKSEPDALSQHETATQRREKITHMLGDPEMAALPDREIARRVGVSHRTVGNLRQRLADKAKTRARAA